MIVDLQVPEAMFRLSLTAMKDIIYQNEIVSQGRDVEMDVPVQLIFRNLNARSMQQAKQVAFRLLDDAGVKVRDFLTKTLLDDGLRIDYVQVLSSEGWDYNLQSPENESNTSLVDVLV